MLINLYGRWVNPQNILAVINDTTESGEKITRVVFNTAEKGFVVEFTDKSTDDVAGEINKAIAATKKPEFKGRGDRGGEKRGFGGGGFKGRGDRGDRGDRGGDRGRGGDRDRGDRGDFKKKFDGDRPERSSEYKDKVREEFSDRKNKKFESRDRGDFKPKKRKDWN